MAEVPEKTAAAEAVSTTVSEDDQHVVWPTGWKYTRRSVLGVKIPHYASPQVQVVMVAFVLFLTSGMFNAVNGIGGGGRVDPYASTASNTAVYATFAVVGFFSGSIVNLIGIRASLSFGAVGYCVYVAAYLCYNHTQNFGFIVFSGALLGVCASTLWAAQGCVMLSYPPEGSKGRYIGMFWAIFNLGAVIGALVPLAQEIDQTTRVNVSDGTYIGFIVLTGAGIIVALMMVNVKSIVRDDGSRVILMKNPTAQTEIIGMWQTLRAQPWILSLFPMFFASNWFYTYQFNDYNLALFDTRTRALNNVLYWMSQIIGAFIFGFFFDSKLLRRSTRAKAGWAALFVLTFVIWGGGYAVQATYTRESAADPSFGVADWTTPGVGGYIFLYMCYGIYDAAWQTSIYWFMGAMSNNSRVLATYVGWYKGIQSAGAAIIWAVDGNVMPSYMSEFASSWGLLAGGLLFAAPMIFAIKDTVPIEEDLKLSDETVEEVLGQTTLEPTVASEKV